MVNGMGWQGKKVAVSGAGNVSIYAVEKCIELGATVLTVSDSKGYIYEPEGISKELLDHINDVKVAKRGSLSDVKTTSNGGDLCSLPLCGSCCGPAA